MSGAADWSAVVPMKKTELLDLNALGWLAEKAEGLTLVDENTLALVNDNDFGLGTMLFDANGQRVAGSMEDCTVDAAGAIVSGCPAGVVGARITRGSDWSGRRASGCCASSESWGICGCPEPVGLDSDPDASSGAEAKMVNCTGTSHGLLEFRAGRFHGPVTNFGTNPRGPRAVYGA